MAENNPSYKKLPGRASGFIIGSSRLWFTEDHLIAVTSSYGQESYQRIYFREIDAFLVRRTKVRLMWNIIFGSTIAGSITLASIILSQMEAGTAALQDFRTGMLAVLSLPAVVALIALIINTAKGATCTFWVKTAGGLTQLSAPVRVSMARKVIDILSPRITEIQTPQPMGTTPAAS